MIDIAGNLTAQTESLEHLAIPFRIGATQVFEMPPTLADEF
jgi:hypothetical protein